MSAPQQGQRRMCTSINDNDTDNDNDNDTSSASSIYSAAQFLAVPLCNRPVIVASLLNLASYRVDDVRKLATLHAGVSPYESKGKRKPLQQLRDELSSHCCTAVCLIHHEHVSLAGFGLLDFPPLSESDFLSSAKALKLRLNTSRKRKIVVNDDAPAKRLRVEVIGALTDSQPQQTDEASDPFQILSAGEKK